MACWLAIDYGTRHIGIAAGDTVSAIASPLEVIGAEPIEKAIQRIAQIAEQYEAEGIVVGWPLNMDDSEGPQGKLSRKIARQLAKATSLDVRMWDERLSSFAADQVLAGKLTRKKKRARQDAVAAATILQDFFSGGSIESAPRPDELDD